MAYAFYGWEKADIRDENGPTPRDLYDLLRLCWSADTCAPRLRATWSDNNPTLGQCSITAFLAQDLLGGRVLGVPLPDGHFHCFNDVDGCVFDLTSEQFGDTRLDYTNCPEQDRAVHFAKAEKKERYELLKERLFARRPALVPITMEHLNRYGEIYAAAFSGPPWNDPWTEADAVIHVIAQIVSLFDADHAAGFALERKIERTDELFCFAGALGAHQNVDHRTFLLFSRVVLSFLLL